MSMLSLSSSFLKLQLPTDITLFITDTTTLPTTVTDDVTGFEKTTPLQQTGNDFCTCILPVVCTTNVFYTTPY